jgi:excisionase family DNA binding protein
VAEYDRGHKGFLSIKEAAVQYDVSRAKVHRLIRAGQLRARKDPRDRRVTLLLQDELDRLFDIPEDTTRDDMNYETTETTGRLTSETRARVDALRGRMAARGTARAFDSTAIIRAERERRSVELGGAVVGP